MRWCATIFGFFCWAKTGSNHRKNATFRIDFRKVRNVLIPNDPFSAPLQAPERPSGSPLWAFWGLKRPFSLTKCQKIRSKSPQKQLKTALKRRFPASPTLKTYFWTKSLEVDFFTQMAPFSTPTAEAGPGAEKSPSGGQKSAFSRTKWCFRGSTVGFSCSSTPKMGVGSPF